MVDNRPLVKSDASFILRFDDLLTTKRSSERRSLQGNRIENFLESCASKWHGTFFDVSQILVSNMYLHPEIPSFTVCIQNLFKTEVERRKTTNDLIHHFSEGRLAIYANAIAVFLAVGGLLVPVFLLFLVPMQRGLMACVALGFVLAFSVTMSVVTGARVQDVLVGTAA